MRFHGLDLNYLATLEVLLVERNLTRAAERLNLTQPAISNTLTKLRQHFGDQLLIRRGRIMERTAFSDHLLKPLQDALQEMRGIALARPQFDAATESRAYRIVASDYIATVLLTELILRIAKLAPHVIIDQLALTDDSIGKLARGEADALICPDGKQALVGFSKRVLFTETFVCIASKTNRQVGATLSIDELYRRPRVIPPYRIYFPDSNAGRTGTAPAITMPFSAIPWFVAKSEYVAVIPERLATLYGKLVALRRVRLTKPIPPVAFVAMCHPGTMVDSFKMWMLDQLEQAAKYRPMP
jgi:LysR family nod box-dependent transcriptional activator